MELIIVCFEVAYGPGPFDLERAIAFTMTIPVMVCALASVSWFTKSALSLIIQKSF